LDDVAEVGVAVERLERHVERGDPRREAVADLRRERRVGRYERAPGREPSENGAGLVEDHVVGQDAGEVREGVVAGAQGGAGGARVGVGRARLGVRSERDRHAVVHMRSRIDLGARRDDRRAAHREVARDGDLALEPRRAGPERRNRGGRDTRDDRPKPEVEEHVAALREDARLGHAQAARLGGGDGRVQRALGAGRLAQPNSASGLGCRGS
jgi:hypothetical protein